MGSAMPSAVQCLMWRQPPRLSGRAKLDCLCQAGQHPTRSVQSAMRRIPRCGRVYVYVKLMCGRNSRRIAIAVAAVIRTLRSDVSPLGRLRELPDFGEGNAALRGIRRMRRKNAAGRGRTRVIDRPVDDLASGGAVTNVFGSDHVAVIFCGHAGAVDAGAESGGTHGVNPGIDVGFLLGQHASALLLVEEDDGVRGKAFTVGGSGGG